jgi:pimeloyl-ACP methyl ester carboxylesterase
MTMAGTLDLVFLIPGFLGFENFRDYAYFGDRFATALRASLSQVVRRPVQVVPVPIPPTGSLAQRQLALAKTLVERSRALAADAGVQIGTIHLVGHSTGGVDAQLLTMDHGLEGRDWKTGFDGQDVTRVRERLRSVISLASPHQGTCLAADPLAQLLASDSLSKFFSRVPGALREEGEALLQLAAALPRLIFDPETRNLLLSVLGSHVAGQFVLDLAHSRALIDDLLPERAVGRYAKAGSSLRLLRRSFVTVAGISPKADRNAIQDAEHKAMRASQVPRAPGPGIADSAPPDALFLLLTQLTSGRNTSCFASAPLLPGSLAALQAAAIDPKLLIAREAALLPPLIDAAVNDGVVNSVRQLIDPHDPNELAGLVIADHFDVVGHYDRELFVTDPKTSETTLRDTSSGLLHSGSRFRDDQFFQLIERVALAMAPAFEG